MPAPPRLGDPMTTLAGSVDSSAFTAFFLAIFSTAITCKGVPVNTSVRGVWLATVRQEFATLAWR